MPTPRRQILVLADEPLARQALCALLRADGHQVSDQPTSGPQRHRRWDVALVDLAHVTSDAPTLVADLQVRFSDTDLVLVGSATRLAASQAGQLVVELELPRADHAALRAVLSGRAPVRSPERARAERSWSAVTPRQREVLRWLAHGYDNPAIAAKLRVGVRAVKAHISALLARFGCDSRTQLALLANDAGLRPPRGR